MLLYLIAKLAVLRNGFEGRGLFGLFGREAKLSLACYTGKTKKQCYRIRHQKAQGMVLRNALQFQRKPAVSRFAPQNTSL
jgi:hypothetical protein